MVITLVKTSDVLKLTCKLHFCFQLEQSYVVHGQSYEIRVPEDTLDLVGDLSSSTVPAQAHLSVDLIK